MLGKRGLYPKTGGSIKQNTSESSGDHAGRSYNLSLDRIMRGNELDAIRWILFYADGKTPLVDIAERTGISMRQLYDSAEKLVEHQLIKSSGE